MLKRAVVLCMSVMMFLMLLGCAKSETNHYTGYYVTSDVANLFSSYLPSIVLSEDNTFLFSTSADTYIKGTYVVDNGAIKLTIIENQTNLDDEYIKDLTFQIKNSDTLVLALELPEITTPSAEFKKVKEEDTPSPLIEGTSQANFIITGTVMDVSLSARIIRLEQPVQDITTVALTEETQILSENDDKVALQTITQGMHIQVTGVRGTPDTLIATQIILLEK